MTSGSLIVIEGIDGSGKGTQARLLVDYLEKKSIPHFYVDFPDYDSFYGNMVAQFLRGEYGSIEHTSPYLISLLYALDRKEAVPRIRQALSQRKIVVANRYTSSNMAHQGSKFKKEEERTKYIQWIGELEYDINHIPRENLVIYLKVPVDIARELTHQKEQRSYLNGKKKDIHEENDDHLKETAATYELLCKNYPHWVTLDCVLHDTMKPVAQIHKEILNILLQKHLISQ